MSDVRRAPGRSSRRDGCPVWHNFRCIHDGVPQSLAVVATFGGRQRRWTGGTGGFLVISQEHELSQAHQQATDRLVREMGDRLPDATIAQCVSAALDELSDAR